jgi:hypothetical protein
VPSERDVVAYLVEEHRPEAILLVGSRADGTARAGSDWDLYVLLPPAPAAARGPVPAPAALDGALLDVGLVRLPVAESEVLAVFGPNLQQSRVLLDNGEGVAARLCEAARARYAAGRGLSRSERDRRRHEMKRNLARMRARSEEAGPFFEALTYFFYTAHRNWFEVLHDRWSLSVHRAMPEIRERDPVFYRQLESLIGERDVERRLGAAAAICAALFPEAGGPS